MNDTRMTDAEAYQKYPKLYHWFNKLWIAEKLGYACGPSGIAPCKSGWYIVRPVMNISGMGVGAKKEYIKAGDLSKVPPGYFWCEWFEGIQYSVTFEWVCYWKQISCFMAERNIENLSRFNKWSKYDHKVFKLGHIFEEIADSKIIKINVEFIDDNPIEVHLRESPDPDYDIIIPIWKDEENLVDKYQKMGYSYINSYDDANGFLEIPRIGFIVK
jgi:hypothetical protein